MNSLYRFSGIAAAAFFVSIAPALAQPAAETYTNLKVLPKDIAPAELRGMMAGFTRALGVRCIHCHVGEEGKPFQPGAFALDDKPEKTKARAMIQMTRDLNEKYLAALTARVTPAVGVQCITCHRGARQPRMLQDVLQATYDSQGIDSTLAEYHKLRERYYGGFTFDFGEVPLADVGTRVRAAGHAADAQRLLALDVDMNPKSAFAKRQYSNVTIAEAFSHSGIDGGTAAYRDLKARFGETVVTEGLMNDVGYNLLGRKQLDAAVAVFKMNVADHPGSANAYDSLGECYRARGETRVAIEAYTRSLALNPANGNAVKALAEMKADSKRRKAKE